MKTHNHMFYRSFLILRATLFSLFMIIYTVFHATLSFLFLPFPLHVRYHVVTAWTRVQLMALKWLCGIDHTVTGLEHISTKNAIILCKHQSAWETLGLQLIFPQQTWVLKKELLRVPFFGWALRLLEPIAIDRGQKREAMQQLIEQGKEKLAQGRYVVIFPEGTRVAPHHTHRFSKGGALLAVESGYPIIPVAHNAGTFWRRRGFIKYPGTIHVVIGAPIDPTNKTGEDLIIQVEQWINNTVAELERE
jgi:1-acyl-sn-glycerol-3-phosphate acyltransferase